MDEMPRDRYFETTNDKVHDRKFLGGPYGNGKSNVYKKAPALYNVKYVKDHAEKVSISIAYRILFVLYVYRVSILSVCYFDNKILFYFLSSW